VLPSWCVDHYRAELLLNNSFLQNSRIFNAWSAKDKSVVEIVVDEEGVNYICEVELNKKIVAMGGRAIVNICNGLVLGVHR